MVKSDWEKMYWTARNINKYFFIDLWTLFSHAIKCPLIYPNWYLKKDSFFPVWTLTLQPASVFSISLVSSHSCMAKNT